MTGVTLGYPPCVSEAAVVDEFPPDTADSGTDPTSGGEPGPVPGSESGPVPGSVPGSGPGTESSRPLAYEEFGRIFLTRVLHRDRVLESIDRILGEEISLGPMGAGPGRRIATLTARGVFKPCSGEMIEAEQVTYHVDVPVEVDFDLDLKVDQHRFHAEVLVPLKITLRLEEPLTIVWDIVAPTEQDLTITIQGEKRRTTVLQKLIGMDGELRRFLVRFVDRELNKPHVLKARNIPLVDVIDGAWAEIAAQFLPNGPEDRIG